MYDVHIYIRKLLSTREMVNFKKWDFSIFLYTFTISCVTTGARKCLLSICFALFVENNAKNHFVAQKCGLFSSVFKKIIPYNTTPTFQEVGGVT